MNGAVSIQLELLVCFISTMPSSPDTVVMVSEYGSIVDDKNHSQI